LQKPTTIRIMLMILYFSIVMFLMNVGILIFNLDKTDGNVNWPFMLSFMAVSLLSMVGLIVMINKRRFILALLISLVFLICSMLTNQLQFLLATVVIVLFVLGPTRAYFRGTYVAPPSARSRTTRQEASDEDESDKAALAEPDEAPATPLAKLRKEPEASIREATPKDADTVYALMIMAFEEYRTAIPPSSALEETEESVLEALRDGSEFAAILFEDDTATAMVRYKFDGEAICFFRLSVLPNRRRRGYARQLVKWIEKQGVAKGMKISRCKVRQSVQNNVVLYQNMGYEIVDQELIVRPAGTVKALTLEKKLWE